MRPIILALMSLALAGLARGDDTDPEPPGGTVTLNKLKGKWISVRRILNGKEVDYSGFTIYQFDGDKVAYSFGKGKGSYAMKAAFDKTRRFVLQLTRENAKGAAQYAVKFEKGELYMMLDRGTDPKAKPDFSGKNTPVFIYKREK